MSRGLEPGAVIAAFVPFLRIGAGPSKDTVSLHLDSHVSKGYEKGE